MSCFSRALLGPKTFDWCCAHLVYSITTHTERCLWVMHQTRQDCWHCVYLCLQRAAVQSCALRSVVFVSTCAAVLIWPWCNVWFGLLFRVVVGHLVRQHVHVCGDQLLECIVNNTAQSSAVCKYVFCCMVMLWARNLFCAICLGVCTCNAANCTFFAAFNSSRPVLKTLKVSLAVKKCSIKFLSNKVRKRSFTIFRRVATLYKILPTLR